MIIIIVYLILWIVICFILICILAHDLEEEYKNELEKIKNEYNDLEYII